MAVDPASFTHYAQVMEHVARYDLGPDDALSITIVTEVICDSCGPLDDGEPRAFFDEEVGDLVVPEGAKVMLSGDAQDRLARHIREHHPDRWTAPLDGQARQTRT